MNTSHYIRKIIWSVLTLLFCCTLSVQAQRSKERRKRTLPTDSIRAKQIKDSLVIGERSVVPQDEALINLDTLHLGKQKDSLSKAPLPPLKLPKEQWLPKPQKALWLALVFPGAGQIYNRKYWKLPIIYGGFVGCAYAVSWNSNMYKDYSQAYQDIMSDNPTRKSYQDFLPSHVDVKSNLSYYQELFRSRKDIYRRQRDLSIIITIGVYLLSVIDAYVDAELSDFDISSDLSMTVAPTLFYADPQRPYESQGLGLKCTINF
ncbi:MAG: DUF5683 domain-containing protein [Phocaeicola sp.]|nr:DUF5683 domain-containing protein [Phocaeicola sp.]MDY3914075.1 DUF5683 domain-containing protein [Phocaeicola sp.]